MQPQNASEVNPQVTAPQVKRVVKTYLRDNEQFLARHNIDSENEEALEVHFSQKPGDDKLPSFNPFTQARNISHKTQQEIADAIGVTALYIMRVEQGVFSRIPLRVAEYYESTLNLPTGWRSGYRRFQAMMRKTAPRPLTGKCVIPDRPVTFRKFRLTNWPTVSQMGWCKAFCVHPAALYAIERGNQESIPQEIFYALIESGVMADEDARRLAGRVRVDIEAARLADMGLDPGKPLRLPAPVREKS